MNRKQLLGAIRELEKVRSHSQFPIAYTVSKEVLLLLIFFLLVHVLFRVLTLGGAL